MKETLLLSYLQVRFLTQALHQWLQEIRPPHGNAPRLSALQAISAEAVLPSLTGRLHRQLLHHLRPGEAAATLLPIQLTLAEMLAVFRCLPLPETQPELHAVMLRLSELLKKYEPYVIV
ncbi:hypothetical protein K3G63_22345 [Hymenobacter sp. HSC-4F20]|uniref:hypothetical protein n=1 Tax=Hymenobacter sp. HSC-4F20 TaxID=2864135 RepID=UPI001C73292E|nr:hypothetical protein [Hymenobacter sp. HSC-4F20]MBX0293202.1 hypothetical protein [Hymenobacter sp. HSC-4F20]